jgi:hypothetical protein
VGCTRKLRGILSNSEFLIVLLPCIEEQVHCAIRIIAIVVQRILLVCHEKLVIVLRQSPLVVPFECVIFLDCKFVLHFRFVSDPFL